MVEKLEKMFMEFNPRPDSGHIPTLLGSKRSSDGVCSRLAAMYLRESIFLAPKSKGLMATYLWRLLGTIYTINQNLSSAVYGTSTYLQKSLIL